MPFDNDQRADQQGKRFIDKYFEAKYKIDFPSDKEEKSIAEDLCILKHSNKICVLTLAPGHSLLQDGKEVTCVDFQITSTTNRLNNKVVGKSKKGGQWLNDDLAPICIVKCSDDSQYTIRSCIRGKLIEVNEKLCETPSLITQKPFTEGYIAIILPKLKEWKDEMASLLTKEQYEKVQEERTTEAATTLLTGSPTALPEDE